MALAGVLEIQLVAGIARLQADMDRATRTVGNATNQISRAADAAKAALAGIGAGIGLSQIIQMTDAYAKFTAQLRLASTSAREYAASYADVKRISTAAQQDLQATGMLYARIANGTRELGTTQKQVAAITETVNMALKVSGATAQESASAQLQLSQAFASGTLRGEEFNAVNEAAPRLMLALADGIGVPVGALKKMAEAGEITSKMMADVLPRSLEKLREEAKEVQTISGAFTVLKNSMMELVGIQANASGGVAVLTGAIGFLADNLKVLASVMLIMMTAKIGSWLDIAATKAMSTAAANRLLAASNLATAESNAAAATSSAMLANVRVGELRATVLAAQGEVQLALATNGLIPAQARAVIAEEARVASLSALAIAQRAASASTAASSAVMGALGGPIGLIITALGAAAMAWSWYSSKADEANQKSTKSTDESTTEMIARLDKQIEKLKERNTLLNAKPELKGVNQADVDGLARAYAELNDARNGTGKYKGESASMRQLAEIDLSQRYNEALSKTATAHQLVTEAANGTRAVQIKEWFGDNGTQAQKMVAELEKLKKKFGEIPPEIEKAVRAKYAATTIKQEATAYQSLITSIGEKIAANKLEMNGYDKLSDAQKMTIKLDEAIASGKNKLTPKHIEEARALIATVAAQDGSIASHKRLEKMREDYAKSFEMVEKIQDKTIEDAIKEAEKNEELARTFGMTKGAIEQLELARLEEQLAQRASTGLTVDEITQLEKLIAAKKRGAAAATTLDQMEAAKKAADDAKAEWKRAAESIENSLTDALMRGFESGKSFGRNLMDTLKNMFKTLILRPIISAVVNPVAGAIAGGMGASGAANAATSGISSGVGSALGIGASMSAFGGTLATGFMNTIAGTGFSASLTAGSSLMAGGATASGAGMIVGALAPIALGIAAAVAIWKKLDTSGTYHTGGASSASSAGVSTIRAESLGFEATRTNADTEKMTAGLVTGIVSILDSTALAFGKTAGYTAATAFADDTSKDGAWGALLIGKLGEKIIDWQDTKTGDWAPKVFADGAAGQTQYLAALSASVRTALDGIGLPSWAQTMLDGLGAAPAIEDIAKVVDSINVTQRALVTMGDHLTGFASMTDAATSALIKASGGIESLASNASAYYDNFYTDGEKSASTIKQITDALAAVNITMPATRAGFREQVEAQLALGAAGAPAVAALLGVAGAFAQVVPALEATAAAAEQVSATLRTADDYVSAFASAGRTLQSELRNVGDIVQSLADRVNSTAATLQSSRDAISSAYFSAEDAKIAAQKRVNDLNAQSARTLEASGASIRNFMAGLNAGGLGSQSLSSLNAQFSSTAVLAKGGDAKSQSALLGIAGKLTEFYKTNSGSAAEEAIGIARVKSTLGDVATAIEALAAQGPADVDPMVEAQRDLTAAQNKSLEYAALAFTTGVSTDRASQITAGSTTALLAAFNAAKGANDSARTDYATALTLTSNLALTSTNSLSGLMAGLQTLSTANTTFIKARDDLATYIIDTTTSAGNLDEFTDDLVTSLGLTGDAATTLADLLADPGTAATTLAGLLGSGAVKVDSASTTLATALGTGGALTTALGTDGALAIALGSTGAIVTALGAGGALATALASGALTTALGSTGALAGVLGSSGAVVTGLGSGGALAGALGIGGAVVNALGTNGALAAALGTGGALTTALGSGSGLVTALGSSGALTTALASMSSTTGAVGLISAALRGTGTAADTLAAALDANIPGSGGASIITNLGLVGTAAQTLAALFNSLEVSAPTAPPVVAPPVIVPPAPPPELTSDQQLIAGLYNEILGRIPDAAGLRYWADALGASTITLTSAATQIAMSAANAGDGTAGSYTSLGAGWSVEKAMADDAAATAWLQSHNIPGFAVGTNSVPHDMLAQIHADERIIPAADNRELMARLRNPSGDNGALVAEIRALREEVTKLRSEQRAGDAANVSATKEQTRLLRDVTDEGTALITTPATQ